MLAAEGRVKRELEEESERKSNREERILTERKRKRALRRLKGTGRNSEAERSEEIRERAWTRGRSERPAGGKKEPARGSFLAGKEEMAGVSFITFENFLRSCSIFLVVLGLILYKRRKF